MNRESSLIICDPTASNELVGVSIIRLIPFHPSKKNTCKHLKNFKPFLSFRVGLFPFSEFEIETISKFFIKIHFIHNFIKL